MANEQTPHEPDEMNPAVPSPDDLDEEDFADDEGNDWDDFNFGDEDLPDQGIAARPRPNPRGVGFAGLNRGVGLPTIPMIAPELLGANKPQQLYIQQRTATGMVVERGRLPADASVEALIEMTGEPGTYLLMPLDGSGNPMMAEPVQKHIPATHAYFREMAAQRAAAAAVGAPVPAGYGAPAPQSSGMPPEMWKLLERMQQEKDEQLKAKERAEAEERRRLAEEKRELDRMREEMMNARLVMAKGAADDATSLHSKIFEREQDRQRTYEAQLRREQELALEREREASKRSAEAQNGFFNGFLQMQQNILQQEKLRMEEQRRQDREAAAEREKLMQHWLQQQRLDMQEHFKRLEHGLAADKARQDMFFQMTLAMTQKQEASKDPIVQLQQMATMMQLMQQISGGGGNADRGIIGELADVAKTVIPAMAGMPAPPTFDVEAEPVQPYQPPMIPAYDPQTGQVIEQPAAPPQPVWPGSPGVASFPPQMQQPVAPQPQAAPPGFPQAATFPGQPEVASFPPQPQAAPAQPEVPVSPINPADSLPPDVRKRARRIARDIVASLQNSPEAAWQGIITSGIMQAPKDMGAYLKAVTVRRAFEEAGAPAEMTQKVITQLRGNPMVVAFGIPLE